MPAIRGNDVLTINGSRIPKQGMARLKPTVTSEEAGAKTKNNGKDEMILAFEGPDGKTERVLVYGDQLDFSFRRNNTEPDIQLNGRPGMIVHYEDEANGFWERTVRGLGDGFKDAASTLTDLARKSVNTAVYGGAASLLGGTIWVAATKGAAAIVIKDAAVILGPKLLMGIGGAAAVSAGIIIVASIIKAMAGRGNDSKMESIAGIIDENYRPTTKPAASTADPAPATPVVAPTTPRRAANTPAPKTPVRIRPAAN